MISSRNRGSNHDPRIAIKKAMADFIRTVQYSNVGSIHTNDSLQVTYDIITIMHRECKLAKTFKLLTDDRIEGTYKIPLLTSTVYAKFTGTWKRSEIRFTS